MKEKEKREPVELVRAALRLNCWYLTVCVHKARCNGQSINIQLHNHAALFHHDVSAAGVFTWSLKRPDRNIQYVLV